MSHTIEVHTPVLNEETDRLYLVDRTGTLQCLRPTDSEMPVFYGDAPMPSPTSTAAAKKPDEAKPAADNPFGAQAAPAEMKPAEDPFGAGGDPFGAGDAAERNRRPIHSAGADPFGN